MSVPSGWQCGHCKAPLQSVLRDHGGNLLIECEDPDCVRRRAAEILTAPPALEQAVFKGGQMRMSVAIKGFELTDKQMAALVKAEGAQLFGGAIDVEELP